MTDFSAVAHDLNVLTKLAEFTSEQETEVQHYIDVGEYGLALETVRDILLEENMHVSVAVFNKVVAIGQSMNLPMQNWQELRKRIEGEDIS